MFTRTSFIAALALMAGPAFAQEPNASPPANETAPSVQTPSAAPPAPSPADTRAAAPSAPEPLAIGELKKTDDDNKMVAPLNATADKVEEMDIYDSNGKKIAEVDSVLEDRNGEVKAIAIEYGGFLGFGEKEAVLTFDQVKQKDGNLVTEMTEEQLPTLPVWNH